MSIAPRKSISIRNSNKYYPSNVMNQIIVNAITGVKTPYRVGSKDSLRLYKVTDTTGAYSQAGKKKYTDDIKLWQCKEPNFYYFDNPAEYMQDRGFHRHAESCDEWANYQKTLVNNDNNVELSVYENRKQEHSDLKLYNVIRLLKG